MSLLSGCVTRPNICNMNRVSTNQARSFLLATNHGHLSLGPSQKIPPRIGAIEVRKPSRHVHLNPYRALLLRKPHQPLPLLHRALGRPGDGPRALYTSPQIQIVPLVEGDGVAISSRLPTAGDTGLHQQPLALVVVVGCDLSRQCGTRAHDAHPFCQDEKTRLPAEMLRLDS